MAYRPTAAELKTFRDSKGLSQAAFGKLIKVDPSTISNLEAGRSKIGDVTFAKYRKAGMVRRGRPPNDLQMEPKPKPDMDAVLLAEKILQEHAPHLLASADPETAKLDLLYRVTQAMHGDVQELMRGQEAISEQWGQAHAKIDALQKMVTAQGDMMEKGFRTLMEPLPDDPDLRSADGQAPGNSA